MYLNRKNNDSLNQPHFGPSATIPAKETKIADQKNLKENKASKTEVQNKKRNSNLIQYDKTGHLFAMTNNYSNIFSRDTDSFTAIIKSITEDSHTNASILHYLYPN